MATQVQMITAMMDKIANQGGQVALLRRECNALKKQLIEAGQELARLHLYHDECRREWEIERADLLRECDRLRLALDGRMMPEPVLVGVTSNGAEQGASDGE